MNDNLTIFGTDYTSVTGIKAKGTSNGTLTYVRPTGTKSITANGTGIDVTQYASVDVAVPTGSNDFIVTLSYNESTQMWEPDKTYSEIQMAYESGKTVAVEATPKENEDTPSVIGEWLPIYGGTFTYVVNEFHYSSVSGNFDSTIKKSYFLDTNGITNPLNQNLWLTEDATATPSDVLSGKVFYNADGQQTGTATTPTPTLQSKTATPTTSQQVITADSGYDGLSQVTVSAMPSGNATAPASITGTAAAISTGTNTLTLTKSVSVTPSVTAGYVSSGTAGDSSVSLTAKVTTIGAQTITPSTSATSLQPGTYLTGLVQIAGDADLIADNIISTANIFGVQGSVVVQNYYTGNSEPSSSLGQNGDIYLQE